MIPIKFPEANRKLNKPDGYTDEECKPLYVYSDNTICLSKWKMSWKERLHCLFSGYVWLWVWFGKSQPPVFVSAVKSPFLVKPAYHKDDDADSAKFTWLKDIRN